MALFASMVALALALLPVVAEDVAVGADDEEREGVESGDAAIGEAVDDADADVADDADEGDADVVGTDEAAADDGLDGGNVAEADVGDEGGEGVVMAVDDDEEADNVGAVADDGAAALRDVEASPGEA